MSLSDVDPRDEDDPVVRKDRRDHGGAPARPDDDALQARVEQERADAGLVDYDPDTVPPATDEPPAFDVTQEPDYQATVGVGRQQAEEGEVHPIDDEHPYPPSHYDES